MTAAGFALAILLPIAQAHTPPPVTGNLSFVGDYRFRGVSQTYTQPAVQAGVDYASNVGAYAGAWGSNVSGNQFLNGASLELDLYGGYRWGLGKVAMDLGGQYYWYPSARYNIDPGDRYNTAEVYLSTRYRQVSAKYSLALTDLFGMNTGTIGGYCGINPDGTPATADCLGSGSTKGSGYLDLAGSFNLVAGLSLGLHYGYQSVNNYPELAYSDFKIGVSRLFGTFTLGAAAVGTNAESRFYRYTPTTPGSQETQDVAGTAIVLSASKAF